MDAFDAILSLWLERQTTDGVVSLLRLWIGSCFNSNYFTNGGFAWKLIPLKETLIYRTRSTWRLLESFSCISFYFVISHGYIRFSNVLATYSFRTCAAL